MTKGTRMFEGYDIYDLCIEVETFMQQNNITTLLSKKSRVVSETDFIPEIKVKTFYSIIITYEK